MLILAPSRREVCNLHVKTEYINLWVVALYIFLSVLIGSCVVFNRPWLKWSLGFVRGGLQWKNRTEKRRRKRQICEQPVYNLRVFNVFFAIGSMCWMFVWETSLLHSTVVMSFPRNEVATVWVDRHISEIASCGLYWRLHLKRVLCSEQRTIERH